MARAGSELNTKERKMMDNKIIYLLTVDQAHFDEVLTSDFPKAFDSLDKAKAQFRRVINEEIEEDKEQGWKFSDQNNETYFEAWADGYYLGNHTLIQIQEIEVE